MAKIEEQVWNALESTINECGFSIYDIEYTKEGTTKYLRIYIDCENGVGINDCETISRKIEPILDSHNFIEETYCLEVSSPGIERVLRRPEHFKKNKNNMVEVSLYKAIDGQKKIVGILNDVNEESVVIVVDNKETVLDRKAVSKINIKMEF